MQSKDQTDSTLLEAALGGNAQAFGALVSRYQRPLFCYARGFLGSDEEAADAVQNTMLRMFQKGQGFRGDSSLKTWLYTVCGNICRNELRRRGRRREDSLEQQQEAGRCMGQTPAVALQAVIHVEQRELLAAAVDALPARQKAVVRLRIFHDLSFREIASAEGISENNAKVTFHHGVKRVRQNLLEGGAAA